MESPWKIFGPIFASDNKILKAFFPNSPSFYLTNTTAGILEGDHLSGQIDLADHACAQIMTPSATKLFTMRSEGASQNLCFHLNTGAVLFYDANQLIPYPNADFALFNDFRMEDTASLVMMDFFAPGRIAAGELFQFRRIKMRSRVFIKDDLVLDDRMMIEPRLNRYSLLSSGIIPAEHPVLGSLYIAGKLAEMLDISKINRNSQFDITRPASQLVVGRGLGSSAQELKLLFLDCLQTICQQSL
jgi:urease accessory protein